MASLSNVVAASVIAATATPDSAPAAAAIAVTAVDSAPAAADLAVGVADAAAAVAGTVGVGVGVDVGVGVGVGVGVQVNLDVDTASTNVIETGCAPCRISCLSCLFLDDNVVSAVSWVWLSLRQRQMGGRSDDCDPVSSVQSGAVHAGIRRHIVMAGG